MRRSRLSSKDGQLDFYGKPIVLVRVETRDRWMVIKNRCISCGKCCGPFSAACVALLAVLYAVLMAGGYERIGLYEEDEVPLAMGNMRTAMQMYAVIFGLSVICVVKDWCSNKSSDQGEKRPLLGSNVGSAQDEVKAYNDGL